MSDGRGGFPAVPGVRANGRLPDGLEVEAVTFDATGTLFHAPRLAAIYAEVFRRHGLDTSAEAVGPMVRRVWQELSCLSDGRHDRFSTYPGGPRAWWGRFIERLAELLDLRAPGPFAVAELFDRFSHAEAWELFPETVPTLERLRGMGLGIAVVSNWDRRLERVVEELGLSGLVDAVVCSSAVGFEKPDGHIFRHALGVLGLSGRPERAVHVGDRPRDDVEGALAAGMHAILVDRRGRRPEPPGVHAHLSSLLPLPRLISPGTPVPTRPRA